MFFHGRRKIFQGVFSSPAPLVTALASLHIAQTRGGKLVKWKSHLQKTKNTGEPQNQFAVSIQIL